jgi:IS30 family transposase
MTLNKEGPSNLLIISLTQHLNRISIREVKDLQITIAQEEVPLWKKSSNFSFKKSRKDNRNLNIRQYFEIKSDLKPVLGQQRWLM